MTHPRNLCPTVEGRARYETQRCAVARVKDDPMYHRLYAETGDLQDLMTNYHEWPDRAGGLTGCACLHCGLTLKQVRVRINANTGKPVKRRSLARAISMMESARSGATVTRRDPSQP